VGKRKPVEEKIPEIEIIPREGRIELIGYPIAIKLIKDYKMSQIVRVRNGGEGDLNNVALRLSGFPLDSYTISPEEYDSIYPGDMQEFTITFDDSFKLGTYDFKLLVTSDSGASEIDGVLILKKASEEEEEGLPLVGAAPGITVLGVPFWLVWVLVGIIILLIIMILYLKYRGRPSFNPRQKEIWE